LVLVKDKVTHCRKYYIDSNQILKSYTDHQVLFMGVLNMPITNPIWQMAAILKNKKLAIYLQQIFRSTWHLARWRILILWTLLVVEVKISKF